MNLILLFALITGIYCQTDNLDLPNCTIQTHDECKTYCNCVWCNDECIDYRYRDLCKSTVEYNECQIMANVIFVCIITGASIVILSCLWFLVIIPIKNRCKRNTEYIAL